MGDNEWPLQEGVLNVKRWLAGLGTTMRFKKGGLRAVLEVFVRKITNSTWTLDFDTSCLR